MSQSSIAIIAKSAVIPKGNDRLGQERRDAPTMSALSPSTPDRCESRGTWSPFTLAIAQLAYEG